jgi:diguanylate cyclase (GGDEF)-like protein
MAALSWVRDPVLRFAYAVIAAGFAALGVAVWQGAFAPLAHPPGVLVALIAASLVLEAVTIRVPGSIDDTRVSASSLTGFSALALYGTGAGIAGFGLTLGFYDLVIRRAQPLKGLFNLAQCTLAVGAAGIVLDLFGHGPAAWAAAAAVQLVVNNGCTTRVASLAMGVPFAQQMRAAATGIASDGALLAYTPIVCAVARINGWLLLLVAVPFAALYWSGREADRRRQEALHDALTGLPNRLHFGRRLRQELHRAHGAVDVVMLDLDGLKDVNDALGHSHGDDVIVSVARRLEACLGEDGLVARLGGDGYGVLLLGADDPVAVTQRLRAAVAEPLMLGELRVHVAASAGIARWPEHGADDDAVLRHADVALHVAKSERTGCEIYDAAQDPHGPDRLALLTELREGIGRGELAVHYQPKLSLAEARVDGVEALVRWQHPRRGLLGPHEFLDLAARGDLMPALTAAVLDRALAQIVAWRAEGLELTVAVNVPPEALHDRAMPGAVRAALERHGLDGPALRLEITESSLMRDAARAVEVLEDLRALGVRVAIDDFGTGYSSLAWLKRLPVNELKIDRSFVMGMDDGASDVAIVESTIRLGQTLGLEVVAEGVETASALERLHAFGCDVAQGYFISRPQPAAELTAWLQQHADGELRAA